MTPAERTAENVFYAVRSRHRLVRVLAPDLRCARCGKRCKVEDLDIDHVDGRTWRVEELSSSARVARYWAEHRAGVRLRALCEGCSARDGGVRYEVDPRTMVRLRRAPSRAPS